MIDLTHYSAKICFTAAGAVVHNEKILLILHKKLDLWLFPGGHCEENELPHATAERECFEETGITAKAVSAAGLLESATSQYLPSPILSNLHWVAKDNFEKRMEQENSNSLVRTPLWPLGCEMHYSQVYLLAVTGSTTPVLNESETNNVGWFTLREIAKLKTTDSMKQEAKVALEIFGNYYAT